MTEKYLHENAMLLERLRRPQGRIDVVMDTDTFNEIDDQYALAYLLRSTEKLDVKAIFAAPFLNEHSVSSEDGMEKSYHEILHILRLVGREDLHTIAYRGSGCFMRSEEEPVISDAALRLVELSRDYDTNHQLYVVSIGAITNIASALLIDPSLKERIVVIWLGGHAHSWSDTKEFNMYQDVAAARVVFGCGVPLIQLPCAGVVSEFRTSGPELEHWLRGRNKLCDYLVDYTTSEAEKAYGGKGWTRVIWDVTAVAWLLDGDFMHDVVVHSPIPEYDNRYSFDPERHFIRYVTEIKRDNLFTDLFRKLGRTNE